jgi:hypothetical protein
MLKPDITFDRFLSTFVPGAVFVFGSFYLHRPLLLRYFPYLAGYAAGQTGDTLSPESRILLFSIAAVCVGAIFDQLSDAAIVSVMSGEEDIKPRREFRTFFRWLNRLFVLKPLSDSRRFVFVRYLESPRKTEILQLAKQWAFSGESEIREQGKAPIVHQHILVHLRLLSEHSYVLYRELYAPLSSAASLHSSLVALFFVALLSPFSADYVANMIRVHSLGVYLVLILMIYLGAIVTAYNLKRRIRNFYSQSLTLALHAFLNEEGKLEREAHNPGVRADC